MTKARPTMRTAERGTALLIVIAMLALVTAAAVGAGALARGEAVGARARIVAAEARAAAQAGIHRALLDLPAPGVPLGASMGARIGSRLTAGPDGDWRASYRLFGMAVTVYLRESCGLIDLNSADPALIRAAVRAAGGETALARAIIARRGDAGASGPAFDAVEELRGVPGLGPVLYRRLAPLVTVECGNRGIDPMAAPRRVLALLVDGPVLSRFLAAREATLARGPNSTALPLPRLDGPGELIESDPGLAVEITAIAAHPSGGRAAWQAVMRRAGGPDTPFPLRRWRAPPLNDAAIAGALLYDAGADTGPGAGGS